MGSLSCLPSMVAGACVGSQTSISLDLSSLLGCGGSEGAGAAWCHHAPFPLAGLGAVPILLGGLADGTALGCPTLAWPCLTLAWLCLAVPRSGPPVSYAHCS